MDGSYLDQALESFSGYVAVDELYDGPWAVLSIVDNHTFRRLRCRVTPKRVTQPDIVDLLLDFQQVLEKRGLEVAGITTDGSNLYPQAIGQVFGAVPHQVCRFHAVGDVADVAREVVVAIYKQQMARLPKLKSGRPRRGTEHWRAQEVHQQREHLLEVYRHRYDVVAHHLEEEQRKELESLMAPYPQIGLVRDLMQQVYGLYECSSTSQALAKLAAIQVQAGQLPESKSTAALISALKGPCLSKSLVFLDHPLLPSTSNAVERANRRHRKMQKSVYRVRSQERLKQRIALDLLREQQDLGREECLLALHESRRAA
jgi:hypothetical protein